jgi:hypothetical protein
MLREHYTPMQGKRGHLGAPMGRTTSDSFRIIRAVSSGRGEGRRHGCAFPKDRRAASRARKVFKEMRP